MPNITGEKMLEVKSLRDAALALLPSVTAHDIELASGTALRVWDIEDVLSNSRKARRLLVKSEKVLKEMIGKE